MKNGIVPFTICYAFLPGKEILAEKEEQEKTRARTNNWPHRDFETQTFDSELWPRQQIVGPHIISNFLMTMEAGACSSYTYSEAVLEYHLSSEWCCSTKKASVPGDK